MICSNVVVKPIDSAIKCVCLFLFVNKNTFVTLSLCLKRDKVALLKLKFAGPCCRHKSANSTSLH